MIKKTISYEDFEGNKITEDFYFNLSKGELVEMELSGKGNSLKDYTERIVKANSGKEIVAVAKEVILLSYGIKTPDGRGFTKSKEIFEAFSGTNAYSELILDLYGNDGAMTEFFNGIAGTNAKAAADQVSQRTASQEARERSEAALAGHRKAAENAENKAMQNESIQTSVEPQLDTRILAETDDERQYRERTEAAQNLVVDPPVMRQTQTEQLSPEAVAQFLKENPNFTA